MRIGVTADIDGDFASRDLLNPSDALSLLAQVADLDGDNSNGPANQDGGSSDMHAGANAHISNRPADRIGGVAMGSSMDMDVGASGQARYNSNSMAHTSCDYPPFSDGHLSVADASHLLSQYVILLSW